MPATADIDEIELPMDLAEEFHHAGGLDERPGTLGQGVRAIAALLNEQEIAFTLEDLYQLEPTRHAIHVDGPVEHVPCVIDALIVALLLDPDPVEVRS